MANYEQFVDLKYKPKKTDVVALFRVKVPKWSTPKRAYGAIASESSVGTWSKMKATNLKHVQKVAAKVFEVKEQWIKIAYPEEHFEAGTHKFEIIVIDSKGNKSIKSYDLIRN